MPTLTITLLITLWASHAFAQDLVIFAPPPTIQERVDMGLVIGSLSMSSIALGITMGCTEAQHCREVNPVMRKILGEGYVRASIVKSSANGVGTYLIWRNLDGKKRTVALVALFALNSVDAIHDIRAMRKVARR